jgi:AraC-like DNA-binding protein
VTYHEHELGQFTRAERVPDPRLAPLLHRPLVGFVQRQPGFQQMLEPPRPALTLMIDFEGEIRADGQALPDAWISGLTDRYALVQFGPSYASIDLELTPLGAYRLLGRPVRELAGETLRLGDAFGPAGDDLADRLRDRAGWSERFDVLESFLLRRAAAGPDPLPMVEWAWSQVRASGGRATVQALAAEIGCSRRYLHERFSEQVGLAPKTALRLTRFERVCHEVRRRPSRWADLAVAAGYADQSHLNRDFRELAGTTPSDFLARQIPGGGVVGDELPFVQDTGGAAD